MQSEAAIHSQIRLRDGLNLPKRILILGLGWSGHVLARHLQALNVNVEGTFQRAASHPIDGIKRHHLSLNAPPSEALLTTLSLTDAIVSCVPPDADGDPLFRVLKNHLVSNPKLRWIGYLSSTSVYGDRSGGWISKDSLADSKEPTALWRLAAEKQWQTMADELSIDSAVFRLPGLYGQGRNALLQLIQGRARNVVRPGLVFNRLHVEDLASVILAAMARPEPRALYLPADNEPAPPQDVLAFAAQMLGLAPPSTIDWNSPSVPLSLRRFYASNKRIDSSETRAILNWQPRFGSYREGLIDAFRADD